MRRRGSPFIAGLALGAFLLSLAGLPDAEAAALNTSDFVWIRKGDALTLDPHAVDDVPTRALIAQVYEPLIDRDPAGKLRPVLAESVEQQSDPKVWRIDLRHGVKFHDGSDFSAADAEFSITRCLRLTSAFRALLLSIDAISVLDPFTLEIHTKSPDALIPGKLASILIMSRTWAEAHDAVLPEDLIHHGASYAATHANGTGPFRIAQREPGRRTELTRFPDYWDKSPVANPIDRAVLEVVPLDEDRSELIRSGRADFLEDVPLADMSALEADKSIRVHDGTASRVVVLGLTMAPEARPSFEIPDRNPLADVRVREAINLAIDRAALQKTVMHGQSLPTGSLVPPNVAGYTREVDRLPEGSPAKARERLAAAGYPGGFDLEITCPLDRLVNARALCAGIARQLDAIGLSTVSLAVPYAEAADLIATDRRRAALHLLSIGSPTLDSEFVLAELYHSRSGRYGRGNSSGFSDPAIDQQIEALAGDPDPGHRTQAMMRLWQRLAPELAYIPIQVETLSWAARLPWDISVDVTGVPRLKYIRAAPGAAP